MILRKKRQNNMLGSHFFHCIINEVDPVSLHCKQPENRVQLPVISDLLNWWL